MPFYFGPTASRAGTVSGGALRMKRLVWVSVAIVFLALLPHPCPAEGGTGSGPSALTLNWNPSSSPGIIGYRIYYGTASGQYTASVEVGNVQNHTITGLAGGVTYYFAVTAFNSDDNESDFSNEISLVPGQSAMQLHIAADGQFVLKVSGLAGRTYDIQATPDLSVWTVIGTVTLDDSGSLDFTDPDAANFSQRFYRTSRSLE